MVTQMYGLPSLGTSVTAGMAGALAVPGLNHAVTGMNNALAVPGMNALAVTGMNLGYSVCAAFALIAGGFALKRIAPRRK